MNASRNRRQFLRTSTALIALPMLESFGLGRLAAASARDVPAPRPKRMIFLGFGWGVTQQSWYPAMEDKGAGYALPSGLAPLARHKSDFTIVQGLVNKHVSEGHAGSTLLTHHDEVWVGSNHELWIELRKGTHLSSHDIFHAQSRQYFSNE